jgi:hypothetical protein
MSIPEPSYTPLWRPQLSPEFMFEMRASIRAYIEDLSRRPKTTIVISANHVSPCRRVYKPVYRSRGKGRGKRVKLVLK